MRYEEAVEMGRALIADFDADPTKIRSEKRENPILADHDEPEYDIYYDIVGMEVPTVVGEMICDDEIRVLRGDSGDQFRLEWRTPADDVCSFVGRLSPDQRIQREIEVTIRSDARSATAKLNTAESGTVHRAEVSAESLGETVDGEFETVVSYTLKRDDRVVLQYEETVFTENTPEETVRSFFPEDESLDHTLLKERNTVGAA